MGNAQCDFLQSLCDKNFFVASHELQRSKLNPQLDNFQVRSDPYTQRATNRLIKKSSMRRVPLSSPDFRKISGFTRRSEVTQNSFRILQVLGGGSESKVYMVKKFPQETIHAMKVISKNQLKDPRTYDSYQIEKNILLRAHHPFIPKLSYEFENEKNVFLVLEYVEGGDLLSVLQNFNRFSEEITRFYSAEILLALEYLHKHMNVIYRDLKPENILFDEDGHIRLIDYGLAQLGNSSNSSAGNPVYFSPEIVLGKTYGKYVDFWSLGCLIYELLTGRPPFYDEKGRREVIFKKILSNDIHWPCYISKNAKDLITTLLDPALASRLGYNGVDEIKKHPFFAPINWQRLYNKQIYCPLHPSHLKLHANINEEDEEIDLEEIQFYSDVLQEREQITTEDDFEDRPFQEKSFRLLRN